MIIKTQRLLLRPLSLSDFKTVHEYASDIENTKYMMFLPNTSEIETKDFLASVELEWQKEEPLFFEGQVDGRIVPSTGDSGFAYDPIFYCYELKKTFGEASKDEKNSVSHRGKALQKLVEYLINTKQI